MANEKEHECCSAGNEGLGPLNAAFHKALNKYPTAFEALHYFWNEGVAGQRQDDIRAVPQTSGESLADKVLSDLTIVHLGAFSLRSEASFKSTLKAAIMRAFK